jgi:DNA-binding IscR family transcriptional regulator
MSDDKEIDMNPELWLPALLAIAGNEEHKYSLINKIAAERNLKPEDVEKIFSELLNYFMEVGRSN